MKNAAIFILKGTIPCFTYDEALPPVERIEFDSKDRMLTLLWHDAETGAEYRQKMESPVSSKTAEALSRSKRIALARITADHKAEDITSVDLVCV